MKSKSLRKKAKVDYTGETTSEYFDEAKTSTDRADDDEDFEIPPETPKRRRSGGSRLNQREDVPLSGEISDTPKKGIDYTQK